MIIAHVISALGRGGMEFAVARLAIEQKKMGRDVRVFCIRDLGPTENRLREAGVPVTLIPFRSRLHPASLLALKKQFLEQGVNVVQTHNYRPNVSGVVAAKLAKLPCVIASLRTVNRWDTRRQFWMDRFLCRYRDAIVCVSEQVRLEYHDKIRCPLEKLKVIHNGIDPLLLEKREKATPLFPEFGLPPDGFYVIMIARLAPIKDHETLLEAMPLIREKIPSARLLLLGEGGLRDELERRAEEIGAGDYVHFLGHRDDAADWLSIADVSVLSTKVEGFSSTILESMASGTPVVATAVGGNLEAIRDGETGFLVPPRDHVAIADRVARLCEDEALYKKIASRARESVEKNFTIRATAEKTLELYEEILKRKGVRDKE